ncbi:MAG: DUF4062 domain-containing protein [Oscillospiraceae bacterium]|jgi:hypothetical protein|nr:DUF4062 domain-containing protein [Oscillospiraceae bacterium]
MIFRPRIFISSTFSDNKEIREKISVYFRSVGAEPLLYERELTPSVIPMTYRENIKEADFVILIMKNNYGTKTDWDISGTHEEYKIAQENKIPMHVYLLFQNSPDSTIVDNPLVDDLKKDQVSFFYFKDDDELFSRLTETTFTIAKEIMISQIEKSKLPRDSIMKLAGNSDYCKAMEVIQFIEAMKVCKNKNRLSWTGHNLLSKCMDKIISDFEPYPHNFLNWKLDEFMNDILSEAKMFKEKHSSNFVSNRGSVCEYVFSGGSYFISTTTKNAQTVKDEEFNSIIDKFFKKYDEFYWCVQDVRTTTDLIGKY